MAMVTPDIVVLFGPRGILSLVGIVVLVAGVWYVDRTWDEKGSAAYERAAKANTKKADSSDGRANASTALVTPAVVIPQEELDGAFPFPLAFILGWMIFALASLFPLDGTSKIDFTKTSVLAAVASLALGYIASIPMGEAVKNRDGAMKQKLGMMFVLSWIVLAISTGVAIGTLSIVLCLLGAAIIVGSMKILWKHRKMGDSWEQEGKPNPHPVVYNMGGPMFVFGWFLFWVGMCGTSEFDELSAEGLPIYFTFRTLIAFLSGCGMVPVVLVLDYAHDEGAEYVGMGTDGRFFGRFWESAYPFLIAWTLLGVAALLPLEDGITTRQWIIFANCILQGIDAGIFIQTALYKGDMASKNKWSIPFVLLFLALAINIGIHGGLALALSLPGAILVIVGQKTVFGDRKRGDYFMQNNGEVNPNPIVYSAGEPLFMTGWILISLAMALPM